MLTPYCPLHRTRVLLSYSDLERILNTPAGIEVTFRCWCGYRGTCLTGRWYRGAGPDRVASASTLPA